MGMQLDALQQSAIIANERGIMRKKGIGFQFASPFARQNLFYLIWSDEYHCDERYLVDRKYMDVFQFIYIKKGSMLLQYFGREYTAKEGQLIFLDLRFPHRYSAKEEMVCQQCLFRGNASEAYFKKLYGLYGPVLNGNSKIAFLFRSLMQELSAPIPDEQKVSLLLFTVLCTSCEKPQPQKDGSVAAARMYMAEHFQEELSVDEIAEWVGLSKYYD